MRNFFHSVIHSLLMKEIFISSLYLKDWIMVKIFWTWCLLIKQKLVCKHTVQLPYKAGLTRITGTCWFHVKKISKQNCWRLIAVLKCQSLIRTYHFYSYIYESTSRYISKSTSKLFLFKWKRHNWWSRCLYCYFKEWCLEKLTSFYEKKIYFT